MRNKFYRDPRKWSMVVHTDKTKSVILCVFKYDTIREIAHVLSVKPSVISNVYHGNVSFESRERAKQCPSSKAVLAQLMMMVLGSARSSKT